MGRPRVKQRVDARECTIGGIHPRGSMILIWNSNEDDGKGLPVYAFPRSARRTSRNTERIKEKEKMYLDVREKCEEACAGEPIYREEGDTSVKQAAREIVSRNLVSRPRARLTIHVNDDSYQSQEK